MTFDMKCDTKNLLWNKKWEIWLKMKTQETIQFFRVKNLRSQSPSSCLDWCCTWWWNEFCFQLCDDRWILVIGQFTGNCNSKLCNVLKLKLKTRRFILGGYDDDGGGDDDDGDHDDDDDDGDGDGDDDCNGA